MPTIAPGVYVKERDFSTYAPALGGTILAMLGGATRGPVNQPRTIVSEADLIRTFGRPVTNDYALHAAIQFLKKGNNLLFTRVATSAVEYADRNVVGTAGGTAAIPAAGTIAFLSSTNPADGDTITLRKTIPLVSLENDANGAIGNTTIGLAGSGVGTRIAVTNFSGGTVSTRAQGAIRFLASAVPADGDTITLNDGVNAAKVFEFDNNATVTGTNVLVAIVASDPYATFANLITAINAVAGGLTITATNNVVARTFEFDNNATFSGSNTPVTIGLTAASTALNLQAAINSYTALNMTAVDGTITIPQLNVTANTAGADSSALVSKVGANLSVSGMTGGANATAGSSMTIGTAIALTPGTWANGIEVRAISPSTQIDAAAGSFDLEVWAAVDTSGELQIVERRAALTLTASDARFVETAINSGVVGEFGPSEYITFDALVSSGTVTSGTYTLGVGGGTVGADGLGMASTDYIGSYSGQNATGLKVLRNPETYEFNVLSIPGVSHKDVISECINLCETRGDAFYLIDTPFGLSPSQVIDWHNGTSNIANAPTSNTKPNSSYAAIFWGWVQEYDPYTKKTLWMPPSGFAAQAFAYNDRVAGPWAAAAGANRGLITGQDIEYKPTLDDRTLLQATNGNRVNPIISSLSTGLQLYGNRTTQRRTSALENIHTRRMLIYVEKLIATATQYLVFEPNDSTTWNHFVNLVRPILASVKAQKGLENFSIISDASTNPASQRQNKVMKGRIQISAIESAEAIEVEFNLFATGASFQES